MHGLDDTEDEGTDSSDFDSVDWENYNWVAEDRRVIDGYRRKRILYYLYAVEELTVEEVATQLGTSPATVSRWLNKYGINTQYNTSSVDTDDRRQEKLKKWRVRFDSGGA